MFASYLSGRKLPVQVIIKIQSLFDPVVVVAAGWLKGVGVLEPKKLHREALFRSLKPHPLCTIIGGSTSQPGGLCGGRILSSWFNRSQHRHDECLSPGSSTK